MPVQRIPRYELLIDTLIKRTSEDLAFKNKLVEIQHEFKLLANKCNEKIADYEDHAMIYKIYRMFREDKRLIDVKRKFIIKVLWFYI